ncbi:serine hydrolase domain-containing protein [Faecalibacter bovis]|uniref:Beta-lactamase family protein n=1 Tax=Faecalibacter bovis TaxID=2898187 RepID=A0ABX7XC88_9FLAO|nr:serine hydrolase domain-containing protein [Faecalibacter bovis]QTV05434.1 beta-lactamase family protein [Faecalibacter bovis]
MYKPFIVSILLLPTLAFSQLQPVFQEKIDSIYEKNKDAIGIIVHVEAPNHNISWSYAKGVSDVTTNSILNSNQPVLIASNTKTYVSAAILRLVELEKISLDQPIKYLLSKETRKLFEDDGYNLEEITVKNLLSHTSGIQDYADQSYFDFVIQNPTYNWTKEEQMKRAVEVGTPQKVGENFLYADINYLLLTEIIEQINKKPFYKSMRDLLKFKELGLSKTWFINLEKYPNQTLALAHQYSTKNKMDSYQINPSWDLYGGGGYASTAKEAALFYHNLFEGNIIKNQMVLNKMISYVLPVEKTDYCLGISNTFHSDLGFSVYAHGGFWGTEVLYSPEINATISIFTLQQDKSYLINPVIGKEFQKLLLDNK